MSPVDTFYSHFEDSDVSTFNSDLWLWSFENHFLNYGSCCLKKQRANNYIEWFSLMWLLLLWLFRVNVNYTIEFLFQNHGHKDLHFEVDLLVIFWHFSDS